MRGIISKVPSPVGGMWNVKAVYRCVFTHNWQEQVTTNRLAPPQCFSQSVRESMIRPLKQKWASLTEAAHWWRWTANVERNDGCIMKISAFVNPHTLNQSEHSDGIFLRATRFNQQVDGGSFGGCMWPLVRKQSIDADAISAFCHGNEAVATLPSPPPPHPFPPSPPRPLICRGWKGQKANAARCFMTFPFLISTLTIWMFSRPPALISRIVLIMRRNVWAMWGEPGPPGSREVSSR